MFYQIAIKLSAISWYTHLLTDNYPIVRGLKRLHYIVYEARCTTGRRPKENWVLAESSKVQLVTL